MRSPAIGRQLVDVSAILVLGFIYIVALSVGTVGTYAWRRLRGVEAFVSGSERAVEDGQPAR